MNFEWNEVAYGKWWRSFWIRKISVGLLYYLQALWFYPVFHILSFSISTIERMFIPFFRVVMMIKGNNSGNIFCLGVSHTFYAQCMWTIFQPLRCGRKKKPLSPYTGHFSYISLICFISISRKPTPISKFRSNAWKVDRCRVVGLIWCHP